MTSPTLARNGVTLRAATADDVDARQRWGWREARFAIGMFDPQFVGRGLGAQATQLVLRHAFDTLGLHRIDLRVLAFNTAAIESSRRSGFVVEGRERCWLEGRWHDDDVIMGILEPGPRSV